MDETGARTTGWIQDGTKWYYLNQDGKMAANTTTPDGYTVDGSGKQGTSGGMVFLFTLLTFGIYGIYWMYQMGVAVGMIHRAHNEERGNAPIVYLLFSLFGLGIVAYALLQKELNKYNTNA